MMYLPPDGVMWDQLHDQNKANQQFQFITKFEKSKQLVDKTDFVGPQDNTTTMIPRNSKTEIKCSYGSDMETDQAEQLDTLLSQPYLFFLSMTTYIFPVWQTYFLFSSFMLITFETVHTFVSIKILVPIKC